jgi:hypothetical protein
MSEESTELTEAQTAADVLAEVANQTPESPAGSQHDVDVALAHESFRNRIVSAYENLTADLDRAWRAYTRDRNIETNQVSADATEGAASNDSSDDPTRAR